MIRAICLAAVAITLIFTAPGPGQAATKHEPLGGVEIGIRQSSGDLDWSIASDLSGTTRPNILSELNFYDMEVTHIWAKFDWPVYNRLTIHGLIDYGFVSDGTVLDSDYFGDNRTDVFSISTAAIDGQNNTDAVLSVGWQYRWMFEVPMWRLGESGKRLALSSDILVTPELGYTYSAQDLRFVDGIQVEPSLGAFEGLRSEYNSEWSGFFVGLTSRIRLAGRLSIVARYRFVPQGDFEAEAIWNLRSDFAQDPSFVQSADFDGQRISAGLEWAFGKDRKRLLSLEYHDTDFETEAGIDETRFADGTVIFTRLNVARYRSHGLSLGFRWLF